MKNFLIFLLVFFIIMALWLYVVGVRSWGAVGQVAGNLHSSFFDEPADYSHIIQRQDLKKLTDPQSEFVHNTMMDNPVCIRLIELRRRTDKPVPDEVASLEHINDRLQNLKNHEEYQRAFGALQRLDWHHRSLMEDAADLTVAASIASKDGMLPTMSNKCSGIQAKLDGVLSALDY